STSREGAAWHNALWRSSWPVQQRDVLRTVRSPASSQLARPPASFTRLLCDDAPNPLAPVQDPLLGSGVAGEGASDPAPIPIAGPVAHAPRVIGDRGPGYAARSGASSSIDGGSTPRRSNAALISSSVTTPGEMISIPSGEPSAA